MCWWCPPKACKYKSAIVMNPTMTSCLTAIFGAKDILQIVLPYHRDFHKNLCRNVLRVNDGIDPNYKLGTSVTKTFKTCQFNESSFFICRFYSEHHLLHSALTCPSSGNGRHLKSRHPFAPAAQQLISLSDNNNIRAAQWADHQRNAEWMGVLHSPVLTLSLILWQL